MKADAYQLYLDLRSSSVGFFQWCTMRFGHTVALFAFQSRKFIQFPSFYSRRFHLVAFEISSLFSLRDAHRWLRRWQTIQFFVVVSLDSWMDSLISHTHTQTVKFIRNFLFVHLVCRCCVDNALSFTSQSVNQPAHRSSFEFGWTKIMRERALTIFMFISGNRK